MEVMSKRFRKSFLGLLLLLTTAVGGCGNISTGGGTPNDPLPSGGAILGSGAFTTIEPGKPVSGVATIYKMTGESYLLRLEGLSVPEGGLRAIVLVNGSPGTSVSLRATTGNQNYTLGNLSTTGTPSFEKVYIFSPPANKNYGEAILR